MLGAEAGVAQREHGEAGVPDRRLARLGPQAVALVDREALPALDRAAQRLVLEAVAERGEHQDRPDPRRLDPAPRAVGLLVRAHPALGLAQRGAAQRPRRRGRAGLAGPRADLAQVDLGVAHRPQRAAGGERDERAARPAGEVVDRERRARREEHELDRDRRHPLPRPLAEQGEEALGEDPRLRDPAARADEVARLRAGVDAGELQRRVGLDRRREVAGAVEPDRPGAVVALPRQQLVGDLAVELGRAQAEDVVPEEVLRGHGHVRLELADPVAVRRAGARAGASVAASIAASRRVSVATLMRPPPRGAAVRARAAARPLRIAPSIVAGQPVPVHAPARVTFGRLVCGPGRCASLPGPHRDRRRGLAADARPEQLGRPEAAGQLGGDPLDQLAAAQLHQLGRAGGDDGQVLARAPAASRSARRGRRPSARRCRAARPAASRAGRGRTRGGR